MVETSLYYRLPQGASERSGTLEGIVELTERLNMAMEEAKARSFCAGIFVNPPLRSSPGSYYRVRMTAPDKVKLQDCLKEFLSVAGLPSCVHGEEKMAEELLVPYGKRLRKDHLHFMARGRSVVDDESER